MSGPPEPPGGGPYLSGFERWWRRWLPPGMHLLVVAGLFAAGSHLVTRWMTEWKARPAIEHDETWQERHQREHLREDIARQVQELTELAKDYEKELEVCDGFLDGLQGLQESLKALERRPEDLGT